MTKTAVRWILAIAALLVLWSSPAFGQEPKAPTLFAGHGRGALKTSRVT
jgi:hypothetical protein